MKIDITEIMNRRQYEIPFSYSFDPGKTDAECVDLPEDITIPENGIKVEGKITDNLGIIMLKAHIKADYITQCARCLEEVHGNLSFDFERTVLADNTSRVFESHITDDGEWDGSTDDFLYVNEASVIPDADIIEELSLELPSFTLCSEDCPGLCPKCGKPLKDGDCGCKEEKYVNPQMAILQKLLENDN